jgi:30S ribosomal protein S31
MGKGDKKTRKGKIIMGSTGVSRPRPSKKIKPMVAKTEKKAEKVAETEEKKTAKKPVAKKPKKEETAE